MADEIVIRSAATGDVPLIHRLIVALAEYERLADRCVVTEADLRDTLFGPQPGAEVLIAEADARPAGFALFFHNYSTFLGQRGIWLEDLFVDPAFRGRGIGKALLARLAGIARDRRCGRLEWSVLDWNEDAIGFYRSLGAVPLSDWTVFRLTGNALGTLADGGADAGTHGTIHSSIPRVSSAAERRIMVVDDSRDAADSLGTILQLMGATVRVVYNGAEALTIIDEFKPHAALLDIGMPMMDGYELARQIRKRDGHDNLRLVALTGWGQDEARKLSREVGFDDHWVKPVDPPTLMKLFESATS